MHGYLALQWPRLFALFYLQCFDKVLSVVALPSVEACFGGTLSVPCHCSVPPWTVRTTVSLRWSVETEDGNNKCILYKTSVVLKKNPSYEHRVSLDPRTSVLLIANATLADEQTYVCSIKRENTCRKSVTAKIYAPFQIEIVANPKPIPLTEDASKIATCKVRHSYPFPHIYWYKDGNLTTNALTREKLSKLPSGFYDVNSTLHYHLGRSDIASTFHCKAVYELPSGTKSAESKRVCPTLHYPPETLELKIETPRGEIKERDTVTLVCYTLANPMPTFTFRTNALSRDGSMEMVTSGVYKQSLMIPGIGQEQSGAYECQAQYGGKTLVSPAVYIHVQSVDPLLIVPSGPLNLMVGDNVIVTCRTTGSGPVNFFWTKGHARVSDGTNLKLDHVNLDTAGQYSCIAYLVASQNISKTQSIDIRVFGLGVVSLIMFLLGTLILMLTVIVCTKRYRQLSRSPRSTNGGRIFLLLKDPDKIESTSCSSQSAEDVVHVSSL
uniref:basal cell adhesion molecule-like isoform X2 n=1 Tax=Myxine glutinosa TaxID=7769 RepID=UPI00358F9CF5